MSAICNTVQQEEPTSFAGRSSLNPWQQAYLDSDKLVASGSAYFAQAFADVMGLVSDEELNDPARGRLRLCSIGSLLDEAIREYEAAADFDARSGLDEYHERALRQAGLDEDGTRTVLSTAVSDGFLSLNRELFEEVAFTFANRGFAALMQSYVQRLRNIREVLGDENDKSERTRGFTWVLLTGFTDALQVGQAIAVLNTKANAGLVAVATPE